LSDGKPITGDRVIKAIRAAQRVAGLPNAGVHVLRQHLPRASRDERRAARTIQELAGHADLSTTQRDMHLSPAATDDAIRLLDTGADAQPRVERGDILETDMSA
jgi:integrase